jgi:murein DD-endopeptidase MepM/ murein hydrolase activator NlpD
VNQQARVGLGDRFQPIPGAQIVRPSAAGDGSVGDCGAGDGIARIPARRGTPVHAVVTAIVLDVDGRGSVSLRGPDGTGYHYAGLDPASMTVGAGTAVAAGDILGLVGAAVLEMRFTDEDGDPLDAGAALVGLADPNELGYVPTGAGHGVDPDDMDREVIAAGLPGPGGRPR